MSLALQLELFAKALDELDKDDDLTHQVLEVDYADGETPMTVRRYKLPAN